MEKIQSLINELENLKNDFEEPKKYDFKFEGIENKQINFKTKGEVQSPFRDEIKKINKIYEFFNLWSI
jgi:hypothetical protein